MTGHRYLSTDGTAILRIYVHCGGDCPEQMTAQPRSHRGEYLGEKKTSVAHFGASLVGSYKRPGVVPSIGASSAANNAVPQPRTDNGSVGWPLAFGQRNRPTLGAAGWQIGGLGIPPPNGGSLFLVHVPVLGRRPAKFRSILRNTPPGPATAPAVGAADAPNPMG